MPLPRFGIIKRLLAIVLCLLAAACSHPVTNPDALHAAPAGYLQSYSIGAQKPSPAANRPYLHQVWETIGRLERREVLNGMTDWTMFSGFKQHTIKITFTIHASGKLTVIDTQHPEDTPKRQLKHVTRMIERIERHLPPFPAHLIEKGEESITDTIIFIFT